MKVFQSQKLNPSFLRFYLEYISEKIAFLSVPAKVICDHVSSKSKGYGFVQFVHESDASIALNEMNDQVELLITLSNLLGKTIVQLLNEVKFFLKRLGSLVISSCGVLYCWFMQILDGWKLRVAYAKKGLDTQGSNEVSNL